jgi:hypothetical protein
MSHYASIGWNLGICIALVGSEIWLQYKGRRNSVLFIFVHSLLTRGYMAALMEATSDFSIEYFNST